MKKLAILAVISLVSFATNSFAEEAKLHECNNVKDVAGHTPCDGDKPNCVKVENKEQCDALGGTLAK